MEMYCNVLKLLLIEELYPAIAAGFNYNISVSEKGITIKMNGFNEKLPVSHSKRALEIVNIISRCINLFILQLLLMAIAKYMMEYPTLVTKDLFEIVKVQQLKTYYNTFIKPGKLVRYWLFIIKHNYQIITIKFLFN